MTNQEDMDDEIEIYTSKSKPIVKKNKIEAKKSDPAKNISANKVKTNFSK